MPEPMINGVPVSKMIADIGKEIAACRNTVFMLEGMIEETQRGKIGNAEVEHVVSKYRHDLISLMETYKRRADALKQEYLRYKNTLNEPFPLRPPGVTPAQYASLQALDKRLRDLRDKSRKHYW